MNPSSRTCQYVCALSYMGARREGLQIETRVVSIFHFQNGRQLNAGFPPENADAWDKIVEAPAEETRNRSPKGDRRARPLQRRVSRCHGLGSIAHLPLTHAARGVGPHLYLHLQSDLLPRTSSRTRASTSTRSELRTPT
jgi:hypothetical protein